MNRALKIGFFWIALILLCQQQTLAAYRVTIEKIILVQTPELDNDEELHGKIWVGLFCQADDRFNGNSFLSRERTLVLFERNASEYVKVKQGQEIELNKSLTFDNPACSSLGQASFVVTASLTDEPESSLGTSAAIVYPTEKVRIYLPEIKGTVQRTIHCYYHRSHIEIRISISEWK